MNDEQKTEVSWAAERMARDGDVLIELATRLKSGADLEWVNRELALVMQDLSLVLSDLTVLSSGLK